MKSRPHLLHFLFILLVTNTSLVQAQYGPLQRISPNSAQVMDAKVGDMDGDGDEDVVVISRLDGKVAWYENDGTGSFPLQHNVSFFVPDQRLLEVLDLNTDGLLDIFLSRSDELGQTAIALINQGSGNFTDQSSVYPNLHQIEDPVKMEMDADGLPDLLDGLVWYKNLGNGQWGQSDTLPVPSTIFSSNIYFVQDVNGDDQPEVFYRQDFDHIGYILNLGQSQTFQEEIIPFVLDVFIDPLQTFGDFDGDGDLDILVVLDVPSPDYAQGWLENDGTGHFTQLNALGLNQHFYGNDDLVAIDLDGIPGDELFDFDYTPTIYELIDTNIVSHGFAMEHGMNANHIGRFADFNGDGLTEVLFLAGLCVAFNDGTLGGWSELSFLDNPTNCPYFKLAQMNEDGAPDIVAGSNKEAFTFEVLYYEGNGAYSHRSEVVSHIGHNIETLFIADYNFDGRPDIGYDEYFNTSFNTILNSWSSGYNDVLLPITDTTVSNELSVAADFDGDEDIDVVSVSSYSSSEGIFLYTNDGGSFVRETVSPNLAYGFDLQWPQAVDIEGDGDIDVVYLNRGDDNAGLLPGLVVLKNDGQGQFVLAEYEDPVNTWYYFESFKPSDLDNDGDIDFVVGTSHSANERYIVVFEYDFDHYVPHYIPVDVQFNGFMAATADVDNDGLTDIVCFTPNIENDATTGLFWYRNLDSLNFQGPYFQPYVEPYMTEIDNKTVQLVKNIESLDRDGDGDDDLFISDLGGNARGGSIYYLENLFWGTYRITGHVFFDADTSADLNTGDYPFQFASVDIAPSQSAFFTSPDGTYNAVVNEGSMTVTPDIDTSLWTISTPYPSYTVTLGSTNPVINDIDFGVIPNGVQPNAVINLTSAAGVCSTVGVMWVSVQNTGNTILSGVVEVTLDTILTPVTQSSSADSIIGNTLYFSLDSLYYFDLEQWQIEVELPGVTQFGSQFDNQATFTDVSGFSVNDSTTDIVVCAYDPNDKTETTGIGEEGLIANGQWLEYTVRFQNTGNYFATDVTIRDQLSDHLDQSTLTPISWSHDVVTSVEPDGEAVFFFENIQLPDSGADYIGSQGFITYLIKADSNLFPGTEILNDAQIFFDQNPPIITNTTVNTVECYELEELPIVWDDTRLRSPFLLADEQQWYFNGDAIPGATGISYEPIIQGNYQIEATYYGNCTVSSGVIEFTFPDGIEEEEVLVASIFPNPNNGSFDIQFNSIPENDSHLIITDAVGREVYRTNKHQAGRVRINNGTINSGMFLLFLANQNQRQYLGKVVILDQ